MEFNLAELMQLPVQHALVNNLFEDQPLHLHTTMHL